MNNIKTRVQSQQSNEIDRKSYLSEISTRDAKWDYQRSAAQSVSTIYSKKIRFTKLHERIESCSNILTFGNKIDRETGEIKLKLQSAYFCHVRNCPVCQWRKALRNTAKFFAKIPELETAFPTHRWVFLTLTVKNCDVSKLKETIKSMNSGWQRMIQKSNWPAVGFVRTTEVTRNEKDGSAHPHFHCLLMVKPSYFGKSYVTQKDWAKRWQESARLDYEPIVDVRSVKPKRTGQTIQAAVIETLKYSTKVEDAFADSEWLYAITLQLHKTRFIATGGTLKGILSDEVSTDEMINTEAEAEENLNEIEKAQIVFSWQSNIRRYVK